MAAKDFLCVVPSCANRADVPSRKCRAHKRYCPTCLAREAGPGLDYCKPCYRYHITHQRHLPAESTMKKTQVLQAQLVRLADGVDVKWSTPSDAYAASTADAQSTGNLTMDIIERVEP